MNRQQKTEQIEGLRASLAGAPSVVVTRFDGLTVEKTEILRSEMRKAGVTYLVVKNTLMKKAIADSPMEGMSDLFRGNSSIAFHDEDPALPAKIIKAFAKENEQLQVKGGWVDGQVLDASGVDTLALLPGKDELRAKLLSVFNAPATSFVRLLNAAPTSFARLLKARADQLENA